ncbi:uncharacterized protein LOC111813994 isoform X1 [Octodon degus]|uniref:Uncharacterized protein LOC111813994 isoform X1 n=1 Tax=Octodon degus TaxID=10160 RepID=A0A6P6DQ42_OCTDE|nr:uncharacterized protein LOC111813994 isoform X1 [Octodon degus]
MSPAAARDPRVPTPHRLLGAAMLLSRPLRWEGLPARHFRLGMRGRKGRLGWNCAAPAAWEVCEPEVPSGNAKSTVWIRPSEGKAARTAASRLQVPEGGRHPLACCRAVRVTRRWRGLAALISLTFSVPFGTLRGGSRGERTRGQASAFPSDEFHSRRSCPRGQREAGGAGGGGGDRFAECPRRRSCLCVGTLAWRGVFWTWDLV